MAVLSVAPGFAADALAGSTTWLAPGGGAWQDPANWSSGVPAAADDPVFDLGQQYAVDFSSAPQSLDVNRLVNTHDDVTFALAGRSLNVLTDVEIALAQSINGRVTVNDGTLNVGGSVRVDQFDFGGLFLHNTFVSAETLAVSPNGSFVINDSTLRVRNLVAKLDWRDRITGSTLTVDGGTFASNGGITFLTGNAGATPVTLNMLNGATGSSNSSIVNLGIDGGTGAINLDAATFSATAADWRAGSGRSADNSIPSVATLNLTNGAKLEAPFLRFAEDGGTGTIHIDGSHLAASSLAAAKGGRMTATNYYPSSAEITIVNGGQITHPWGVSFGLGTRGSHGVLVVDGPGSRLDAGASSTYGAVIGGGTTVYGQDYPSDATLTITNGGFVRFGTAPVTIDAVTTIDGANSKLITGGTLDLRSSTRITNGAEVRAGGRFFVGVDGRLAHTVADGCPITVGGELRIGYGKDLSNPPRRNMGLLEVINGGTISSDSAWLGGAGGAATFLLSGSDVRWTNTNGARIGLTTTRDFGTSDVIVEQGAVATIGGTMMMSPGTHVDLSTNASLTAGGLTMDGGLVTVRTPAAFTTTGANTLGTSQTFVGGVQVSGGSASWSATGTTSLTGIGVDGGGTLLVEQGARFDAAGTVALASTGSLSSGSVLVTGTGSRFNAARALTVGNGGTATFMLADTATATAGTLAVGRNSVIDLSTGATLTGTGLNMTGGLIAIRSPATLTTTSNGTIGTSATAPTGVLVSGPNAVWNANGSTSNVRVGSQATGSITIEQGAALNASGTVALGHGGSPAVGDVLVTGAGSRLVVGQLLDVGAAFRGTLTLADGGTCSIATGRVAPGAATAGTILLTGAGSRLDVVGSLSLGGTGGAGRLFVNDDTTVNVAGALVVGSGGTAQFNGGTLTAGTLSTSGTGRVIIPAGAHELLRAGAVTTTGGGTIDLSDNRLRVTGNSTYAQIASQIAKARGTGTWNGAGISSSTARSNPSRTTTLGTLTGQEYLSLPGSEGSFQGDAVGANDVLVRYTYYGDTDFSGRVDFADYTRIDTGFNTGLTGWLNGDFNYSGNVSFDDYVLIDIAFNAQSGTLARAIAWISGDDRSEPAPTATAFETVVEHFQQFGFAYASSFLASVPEPAGLLWVMPALGAALTRRRRVRAGDDAGAPARHACNRNFCAFHEPSP